MRLLEQFGVCDCHSHVFGPFASFPLSPVRTFDPPESPIENLETVWESVGIDRTILIQGSAHGEDHTALMAAIERSPKTRRGVALLSSDVSDETLTKLEGSGIRAVRFNWIRHLLGRDSRPEQERLNDAAKLLTRISRLGWHVEVHIDIADLDLLTRLAVPRGMAVVIDHMARIDVSASDSVAQLARLLRVLELDSFWVKISGADRLTLNCEDLKAAVKPMRRILEVVPDRCIWGLDWPHVNLARKRPDSELADLLHDLAGDRETLERILIHNPARLYGFDLESS